MTKKQKKMLWRIIVAAALTAAAWFAPVEGLWKALAFVVPYLIAGWDVLLSAVRNILHGQVFDEKFLMTVATGGAFAIGEYPEAAAVMIFYQVGELFQSIAVGKSRRSIAALMDIRPDTAVVIRDGKEYEVSPEEVAKGETIIIRPGERIPLDGVILDGSTSVDTAALTGESVPVERGTSDRVISGSVNLTGVIRVRTDCEYAESTVSRILELVENSSEKKAKSENFITRFARRYTPCVVIGAVLLAVIPPLFFSQPWSVWINRALIFLVVSCPCALVVSVPLTFFGGIGGASRRGILVKGGNYLETLADIDTFVFDKTGTLTRGVFAVEAIHPENIGKADLLDIAAIAESYSAHPVAQSIIRAHEGHIDRSRLGQITEIAGKGIKAIVDGSIFYIGNEALMREAGASVHKCHLTGTVIHIAKKNEYLGHIVINDEIKPEAADAIAQLGKLGIKQTVMLTGDVPEVAETVAGKVGVDRVCAGLLPEQKVEKVEELLVEGRRVAFVGDGVNDAPVLARADIGAAMGALGSDAAIESADVVLMDDDPSKLADAVRIARRTVRIVNENIWIALAVKAVILLLGALGIANMWTAVFGDVGVMVLAILNATRALIYSKPKNI